MKPDLAQPGASRATYRSLRQRIQGRELGVREVVTPFLCVAVPLSILFLPLQISTAAAKALAISLGMVLFWIFMPIEHAIVGMIGCFLYWAAGCVNFETAFNGFAQDTPWFLYGAIILGTVAARTGLARRLAYLVMSVVGVSYGQILAGIIFVNFLLTFIVPSGTARVVILASICLGIVEAFGVAPKSNVARGLFIVFTYTATIFDKMLIAGASSLVARGLIERDGGVPVYYSQWFFAYLPCDLLTIAACWAVVMWLYPPEKKQLANGREYIDAQLAKLGPFSSEEKRASVLMLAALALWLTDFLHHIPASMIGIGAGLAACLPLGGLPHGRRFVDGSCVGTNKGNPAYQCRLFLRDSGVSSFGQSFDSRPLLDGVLLSLFLTGAFEYQYVDAVADELRQIPQPESSCDWDDLDLCCRRQDFHVPVPCPGRRLFVRPV